MTARHRPAGADGTVGHGDAAPAATDGGRHPHRGHGVDEGGDRHRRGWQRQPCRSGAPRGVDAEFRAHRAQPIFPDRGAGKECLTEKLNVGVP